MSQGAILTSQALSRAAFLLLSSSALARYLRMARQVGEEEGLVERIQGDPALVRRAIDRIDALWGELIKRPQRDLQEIEIAVLLVALVDAGVPGIGVLLRDMAASKAASAVWLRGLAAHLLVAIRSSAQEAESAAALDERNELARVWSYARLTSMVGAWLGREHGDAVGVDPDTIARMRLKSA